MFPRIIFSFLFGFSFTKIHFSQDIRERLRPFLTPLYNFHPLHRQADISWGITAESLSLHVASDGTRTENSEYKSLTTKRVALYVFPCIVLMNSFSNFTSET